MKYLDEVRVITDKYKEDGIEKGAIGTIIQAQIQYYSFDVIFEDEDGVDYAWRSIDIADMELAKEADYVTDEIILSDLPNNDPNWWCKVENGYILNLKGEKKNKIPYDYDS